MSINADVQSLEPGKIVTLYEFDATLIGAERYFFHSYDSPATITWQGVDYTRWPMEASGFQMKGGASATPRLKMGNVGGFITALVLGFDDLIGSTLIRRRTLGKYLDGMPEADPDEHFPDEVWYVEQKVTENNEFVEFELASALDFNGVQLPRRQIIANSCPWRYRSAECGYTGGPVANERDIIVTDAQSDQCGKRLQSCKLRFGATAPLPFGGFAAAGLVR